MKHGCCPYAFVFETWNDPFACDNGMILCMVRVSKTNFVPWVSALEQLFTCSVLNPVMIW